MANAGDAGEGVHNINVAGINSYTGNGENPNTQNSNMMMQGQVREGQGFYNVINVAGNGENPNTQNSNMMMQGQVREGQGFYNVINVAGNDAYPGNSAYPNIQNNNMMIQGQGQYQELGRVPYGYNQAWYPGAPSNMLYVEPNYNQGRGPYGYIQAWHPGAAVNMLPVQPDSAYPSPPPATNMNNQPGSYSFFPLQAQPQFPVQPQPGPQRQPQPGPQPVFDAGRRGSSSSRHSGGRNSNTLQEAGRGRGRVFRDNNYNINTALPQAMGNIGEPLMRMRVNEGESSTQLQGQGRVEPDQHANAAVVSREYSNAKFFVIKSCSKENVVSSVKYKVWTSSHRGNRILNTAFREARHEHGVNAIFLFFSVKGSGNFCGVAEMDGPVDFEASADCWDRDWKGKFRVKWHTIKDVPYSQFEHITFNTAENPNQISIIHGRDAQEVESEKGVEMLNIFDKYVSTASLLDDVSKSTESRKQQQSQPTSSAREHQEEQPEGKGREKEKGGKNGCEQYCTGTGSANCDINTNQIKLQDTIEDSPNDMQLQEILNILEKGMEKLDIFGKYVSTASLLDDVSESTASPKQQQSQPPSPARQQQEDQPEGKENEKEKGGENGCELYGTGTGRAYCDINTNQLKLQDTIEDSPNAMQLQEILNIFGKGMEMLDKKLQDTVEDSPNDMQLKEILNTDETTQDIVSTNHESSELLKIMVDTNCDTDEAQQTHLDNCMKPPAKTTVDKEETHQSHAERSYEPEKLAVDIDATTQVNEVNTGDTIQKMTTVP